MDYEALLAESDSVGLVVKEKPLKNNNGRVKGNKIAIRQDINTSAEKACVLAEGDAADRTDIIYLEPLPLFFK